MASDTHRRFIDSVGGGSEWNDYLDLPAYEEATATEQAELDALILQRAQLGDARAARAIAALWGADRACAVLLQLARQGQSSARVPAATALYALARYEALAAYRAVLFADGAAEDQRVAAVHALAQLQGADVDASLRAALEDASADVRERAQGALAGRTR
jgi:HEAT repeat protein